jgi:hypothetical protein
MAPPGSQGRANDGMLELRREIADRARRSYHRAVTLRRFVTIATVAVALAQIAVGFVPIPSLAWVNAGHGVLSFFMFVAVGYTIANAWVCGARMRYGIDEFARIRAGRQQIMD